MSQRIIDHKGEQDSYEAILRDWNERMKKLSFTILLINLAIELIFMGLYMVNQPEGFYLKTYFPRFVLLPTVINISSYLGFLALYRRKNISDSVKGMILMVLFAVMVSCIIVVHYVFEVLYMIIIIPLFASIIYGNIRITRFLFYMLQPVYFFNMILIWITKEHEIENFFYNVIVGYVILCISYYLVRSIVNYENRKERIIIEQVERNRILEAEVLYDGLTHIYNHTGMYHTLNQLIDDTKEEGNLTIAMIDLDYFKLVNDDYGHEAGNEVLERFGSLLHARVNDHVSVARYGGEEFCVIFSNLTMKTCKEIMTRLLSEFVNQSYDKISRPITFSAGLAEYEEGMTISQFIAKADRCLYAAKKAGRNCIKN